ncbi:MAG TPA: hypothetical protein EYQ50_22990 [Verrucomicrobiales bacterium]|nr:hypothetical protein [Verrucomicrobiales bacterium]
MEYSRRDDRTVNVIKDVTEVRDISNSVVYRYMGENTELILIEADFSDALLWEDLGFNSDLGFHDPDNKKYNSNFENVTVTYENNEWREGFLGTTKVYQTIVTTVTGIKDYYTFTLKADYPVDIVFLKQPDPGLHINTTAELTFAGNVELPEDANGVSLNSGGSVNSGDGVAVFAHIEKIVAQGDVELAIEGGKGPTFVSATGDIQISVFSDDNATNTITVGNISTTNGDILISAKHGIFKNDADSLISGNRIELDSLEGSIDARIDSNVTRIGGLAARSGGDIDIEEIEGDILLVEPEGWESAGSVVSLEGDVTLETVSGSILDAVFEEARADSEIDPALEADLAGDGISSDRLRYATSSSLIRAISPHSGATGSSVSSEVPNLIGKNITLIAGGSGEVGVASSLLTILRPQSFDFLSLEEKEALSIAGGEDVIEVQYEMYEYLGANRLQDLNESEQFENSELWRRLEAGTGETADFATTDGEAFLQPGKVVVNKFAIESLTLQAFDDLNIEATGNVSVESQGNVVLTSTTDMTLRSVNGTQEIRIKTAAGIFAQPVGGFANVAGDNIHLFAGEGSIGSSEAPIVTNVLTFGMLTASAGSNIHMREFADDLRLKTVVSLNGDVDLRTQFGSIVDALDNDVATVVGNTITLAAINGGVGEPGDPLELNGDALDAFATTTILTIENEGDLRIVNNGSRIGKVGMMAVRTTGAMTIDAEVSLGLSGGSVLLEAQEGDLTIGGNMFADGAVITLLALGNVTQRAGTEIRNVGGTIDVLAVTGSMTQEDNALITTGGAEQGAVRIKTTGDIMLGGIEAGGVALLSSSGSILDGGDSHIDLIAGELLMNAEGSIGSLASGFDDSLDISVATVSGQSASGEINLLETDNVTVGQVNVTVQRVASDGSTSDISQSQSDLISSNGRSLVLRTLDGSITIEDGNTPGNDIGVNVAGDGNVLIQAQGTGARITVNADVRSGSGHITLRSTDDVELTGSADITTDGGSVEVVAENGSITMADGTTLSNGNSEANIRLWAGVDVIVTGLDAGTGAISVTAETGSIRDGGDTSRDFTAAVLRLVAAIGMGALGALEMLVDSLAAQSGEDGINLVDEDNLVVALVLAISVSRVTPSSETEEVTDSPLSRLFTRNNGSIALRTLNGSITVQAGTKLVDDIGVSANGSGNITLEAQGSGSDVTLHSGLRTGAGNISVVAADSVIQSISALIATTGGTIDIDARSGAIIQHVGALITTESETGGAISLRAGGDIQVERIQSARFLTNLEEVLELGASAGTRITAQANVSLVAGGGIGVASLVDSEVDVIGNVLTLDAQGGVVGLDLAANILNAKSAAADITLTERDGLAESSTGVTLADVRAPQGSVTVRASKEIRVDFVEAGNDVALESEQGGIVINQPASGDAIEAATGSELKNIVLEAALDIDSYAIIRGNERIEYRAGGAILLPDGTEHPTITTHRFILESLEPLVVSVDLEGVDDVHLLSGSLVDYTGRITNVGNLMIRAADEVTTIPDGGTIRVDTPDDIGADNIQLRAAHKVTVTRNATRDYMFKGIIGGLADGDKLTEVTISTGGVLTLNTSAATRIDSDRLVIDAGQGITVVSDGAFSFNGGRLTAGDGHNITITAQGAIELGSTMVQAPNGTVDLTAHNGGQIVMAATGLIEADLVNASGIGAIELTTNVNRVSASLAGSGDLIIEEQNDAELVSVSAPDGLVLATAGGTLTATHVVASSEAILTSLTGSVLVDSVRVQNDASVQGVIRIGAENGQIREVDSHDTGNDLVGFSASLRAQEVLLNSSSFPWATQSMDAGLEIDLSNGANNNLDASLILGDVELNNAFLNILDVAAGSDVIVNATGSVTVAAFTNRNFGSLQINARRNISVIGELPNIPVTLKAGQELNVLVGVTLRTSQDLSLSASGNILGSNGGLVAVDVGGKLNLESLDKGNIRILGVGGSTLVVGKATVTDGELEVFVSSRLIVEQLNVGSESENNRISLSTLNRDITLGVVDIGRRGTLTLTSAGRIGRVDASSVVRARMVTATATSGVDLRTELDLLNVENSGSTGVITVTEVPAGGGLRVASVVQATENTGEISIATENGNITVLESASSGTQTIVANGKLTMNAGGTDSVIEIRSTLISPF